MQTRRKSSFNQRKWRTTGQDIDLPIMVQNADNSLAMVIENHILVVKLVFVK